VFKRKLRSPSRRIPDAPPDTAHPQMGAPKVFEHELPRSPEAPGLARRSLSEWYLAELDHSELHRAKLLASELVTNAVLHGQGQIMLKANLDDYRLLVEVSDEGPGFEHKLRPRRFEDVRGRGLAIVDAESSRWGLHNGSTHVWFELERHGPRLGSPSDPAT
jgi:serine/threonine-protein kinase RsbW